MKREQLHASISWPMQAVHFFHVQRDEEGHRQLQTADGWVPLPVGMEAEPTFTVSMDTAQALFEELWAQGFRSVHDRGGADKLDAARKEHIEDLRKAAKLK